MIKRVENVVDVGQRESPNKLKQLYYLCSQRRSLYSQVRFKKIKSISLQKHFIRN